MAKATPDRGPFFGRKHDLDALLARVGKPGVTAIVGRPQIGKTRLLVELCDRLKRQEPAASRPLVGYARATADTRNHLLYALRDLNVNDWLPNAGMTEQAKRLYADRGEQIITRFGVAFGKGIAPLLRTLDPSGGFGELVGGAFKKLYDLDTDLRSGGLELPIIATEQACSLMWLLHSVSARPLVLVLDAFEQQEDPQHESSLLGTLLSDWRTMPPVHILLAALQPGRKEREDATFECINELHDGYSPTMVIVPLSMIALESDVERDAVVHHMRERVPAAKKMKPEECISSFGGYPGALDRIVRGEPQTRAELETIARNAWQYHYPEVKRILRELREKNRELFELAIRLALLPEITSPETWQAYAAAFELNGSELADLHVAKLTEDGFFPFFGHTTRYDQVRHTLLNEYPADVSPQASRLVMDLAATVRNDTKDEVIRGRVILGIRSQSQSLRLDERATALCALLACGTRAAELETAQLLAVSAVLRESSRSAALCSMMVLKTLNDAKDENDLTRRDALLDELRKLHAVHADDAAVRELLAKGLFNTLVNAKDENDLSRRDALLDELRALHATHVDDAAVRAPLANGLFNTLNYAKDESNLSLRDVLLNELRELYAAHSDDAAVRKSLGNGLVNTLIHAKEEKEENDLSPCDALLNELRALYATHVDDAAVRESLGNGLVNTLIHTKEENGHSRRDMLLDELRELHSAHRADVGVRVQLANGLYNTLIGAKAENDLPWRDALLDELRGLQAAHDDDAAVRERLAKGLYTALNHAKVENDLSHRDPLVEELRRLHAAHTDDATVREQLAKGLAVRGRDRAALGDQASGCGDLHEARQLLAEGGSAQGMAAVDALINEHCSEKV